MMASLKSQAAQELERAEEAKQEALAYLAEAITRGVNLDDPIQLASIKLFEARASRAKLEGADATREFERKILRGYFFADWAAGLIGLSEDDRRGFCNRAIIEAGMRDDDPRLFALIRDALRSSGHYATTQVLEQELERAGLHALETMSTTPADVQALLSGIKSDEPNQPETQGPGGAHP